MKTYADHVALARTGGNYAFHGDEALLPWICFLGRTRDSESVEEVNFQVALEALGGEGDHVQIIRENHWAVGWIEFIIIHPEAAQQIEDAEDMLERIENYPILDEMALSDYEWENHIGWSEIAGVEMPPEDDPWSDLLAWRYWIAEANAHAFGKDYEADTEYYPEDRAIREWLDDLNTDARDKQLAFNGRRFPDLTEEDLPL
jgi:hypothetical protein